MSDSPEGRSYVIQREWQHNPDTEYCLFPDDYVLVETTQVVPNGAWIMEWHYGCTTLVGITRDELQEVMFFGPDDDPESTSPRHTLLIGDKPFGFVSVCDHTVDSFSSFSTRVLAPRMRLYCAQQIHKGELGQSVPIPRLSYVRQAFEPMKKPSVRKARERKRSNLGWVRLTDLAAAANLTTEDLVFGFWRYSGHLNGWFLHNDQNGGQLLDIVVASSPADIRHQVPEVIFATMLEASDYIGESEDRIWVRRGFAYTVLRLLALGVRPEVDTHV